MLVIAHRGVSSELPENTLPAFERAIEVGADYVELDVHADRGRPARRHARRRRARTRVPDPRGGARPDARAHRRHGRAEDAEPLPQARRRRRARSSCSAADDALVCFQRAALDEARALRPGLRTVQHVGFAVSIRGARGAWAAGFYDPRVTRRGIRAAQALGLVPLVYTVNDERRMRELADAGAAGIFTDVPATALRLFRADPL